MKENLHGYKVEVIEYMAGCRKAVKCGRTLYVSPAMWGLMMHTTDEAEMQHLLSNIQLIDIPEYDFTAPLPMSTKLEDFL